MSMVGAGDLHTGRGCSIGGASYVILYQPSQVQQTSPRQTVLRETSRLLKDGMRVDDSAGTHPSFLEFPMCQQGILNCASGARSSITTFVLSQAVIFASPPGTSAPALLFAKLQGIRDSEVHDNLRFLIMTCYTASKGIFMN
jgi:hypothetical protein